MSDRRTLRAARWVATCWRRRAYCFQHKPARTVMDGRVCAFLRVYRALADAYDIQFDQDTHHWAMQGRDLESAAGEPPSPSAV